MNEGYMALVISILKSVPPDTAFRMLNGEVQWQKNRHWTADDMNEIGILRQQGMKWSDIGKIYNVSEKAVCCIYFHYKNKIEEIN